jgi:hypothetical protein
MPFGFLQHQQMLLKHGVVEVQPNRCFITHHDQGASGCPPDRHPREDG